MNGSDGWKAKKHKMQLKDCIWNAKDVKYTHIVLGKLTKADKYFYLTDVKIFKHTHSQ